jgi:hypothetical protein
VTQEIPTEAATTKRAEETVDVFSSVHNAPHFASPSQPRTNANHSPMYPDADECEARDPSANWVNKALVPTVGYGVASAFRN